MQRIESNFKKTAVVAPSNARYATSPPSYKPQAPFREVPLLGHQDQSTIHFHCGISNNFSSVVDGGFCLNESLDRRFAVQPHLIHPSSLSKGLNLVGLEKFAGLTQDLASGQLSEYLPGYIEWPRLLLENTLIQRSIDYEIANLTAIAQNIIAQGNPNLKQVHVTFSNGGFVFNEALKRLLPQYRETIVVITAGTTAIIDNQLAHKVYNVIGDKDWPSHVCNGGLSNIEKSKESGVRIFIIPQSETQGLLGGHYFMQLDYQKRISDIIKTEIEKAHEIY